ILQTSQAMVTILHASSGTSTFSEDSARVFQTAPRVSISATPVTAAAGGPTVGTVSISLTAKTSQTVSVSYATEDGTAKAGSDYVAVPATPLNIAPGDTQESAAVTVNPQPRYDLPKSFTVLLST